MNRLSKIKLSGHVSLGQNCFIENNGVLTEIHLQSVTYTYNVETKRYEVTAYNEDNDIATKTMYSSIEDYKKQHSTPINNYYIFNLRMPIYYSFGYYYDTISQMPKEWHFVNEITSFTIYEDDSYKHPHISYNGFMPNDLFPTREDLLLYYPLNVKRLSKDNKLENGKLSFLLLDTKQQKLVTEFKDLLQKMKESNIRFFIENDVMNFINIPKNIKCNASCYDEFDYDIQVLNKNQVLISNYMGEYNEGISMEFYDENNNKI